MCYIKTILGSIIYNYCIFIISNPHVYKVYYIIPSPIHMSIKYFTISHSLDILVVCQSLFLLNSMNQLMLSGRHQKYSSITPDILFCKRWYRFGTRHLFESPEVFLHVNQRKIKPNKLTKVLWTSVLKDPSRWCKTFIETWNPTQDYISFAIQWPVQNYYW